MWSLKLNDLISNTDILKQLLKADSMKKAHTELERIWDINSNTERGGDFKLCKKYILLISEPSTIIAQP